MSQPFIKGNKINLYAATDKDIDFILDLLNHPEIRDYISLRLPRKQSAIVKKIDSENDLLLIIKDVENKSVGVIELGDFNFFNRRCMLSISILPEYQNLGYGKEATELVVSYGFDVLGMHKIGLEVYEYNERAIALYEKIGFKREALYRKHSFKQGKFVNLIYMAIIEDEYRK